MTNAFGFETTTEEVLEGIELSGKLAVITGATSGLGLETARALASKGAKVVILGRNPEKLKNAENVLSDMNLAGEIDTALLDLADLDNVRVAAEHLLQRYTKIDILVNNAGVMICPFGHTKQGFETHFGTNHMGHFLFTCLLVPALRAAASARVINLASAAHRIAPVDFDDPNFENRNYEKWVAYGNSKTANVLFSVALDARLKDSSVRSLAVHPGMILTDIARHITEEEAALMQEAPEPFKTVPQGAATSVWAATSPDLRDEGAKYLANCQIAPLDDSDAPIGGVKPYALCKDNAERLWSLSERLLGEQFPL